MTLAAIRHHRLFPRFAIFTGGASALAIVLTAGAVLSTTSDARTASTPTFSTFERVVEAPEMLAIVPSPVEAIKPDTEPGAEKWLSMNAQYAKLWPNITLKKEPPADAKEWERVPDKAQYFSPNPGDGT